jgi:hypothetical protein
MPRQPVMKYVAPKRATLLHEKVKGSAMQSRCMEPMKAM